MNIVILVSGLPPDRIGGAEIQAARLAEHLTPHHRVTVLTRSGTVPAELRGRPHCDVLKRCRVSLRGLRFGADIASTLLLIARRRRSIDAIVAYQTVIDGLIGVLAKLLFGIPVLVSVRSEIEYQFGRNLQTRLLAPFVFRRANRIAVQSSHIARDFLSELKRAGHHKLHDEIARKLCVIPNGISTPSAEPETGDTILFVGRLVKVKGVEFLIAAMRECPNETLLIVGDGPENIALRRAAAGMHNVSFVGSVAPAGVQHYISRAKVLVVPSLHEGLPNVILEAMACGVPVIATNGGGIPSVVKHSETGFLTSPGDSSALALYINLVAGDPDLRARLARNCLAEMRPYRWPVVIETVHHELIQVTSGSRRVDLPDRANR